ncbi:alpha/beta fold hydrolase [Actinokineospora xionganensis]|uniref:Alpha/beta fold hydrolase n=1 Tax=Actinokineospora xionganensis TaxID=2684470 RepID=A0ABR7LDM1_9PSEU|nr:alpha/beta hydrolase [Actinokineospora xionganensis]MBC6450397.1 alpha/beta fold hydrolase [Actinokineospora xionganensis]
MHSQLSPHRAVRADLSGPYGPIGALRIRGEGPIALLVPGCTGSKEDFAPLLDPIADAGFDVVAIDLPGHQDSPGPADEASYLPAPLGQVVAELVGKLAADGRPVVLMGHSYGGLVSRRAVLAGAEIVGLTLLSSGPGELPSGGRRAVLELAEPILHQHGIGPTHDVLEKLNASNPRWQNVPAEQRVFLRDRFLRNSVAALVGMGTGLRGEPDLVGDLARSLRARGTSCLVACGADDDAWSPSAQRDMADRLEADFSMIAGAAHSPATENPAELLATLLPTWKTWLA